MTQALPNTMFADCLRIYQEGEFETALVRLKTLLSCYPEGAPNWFALLGNIHFKLGDKEAAGDAFSREADHAGERAGPFVKLAVTLYSQCGLASKIHRMFAKIHPLLSGDPAIMHTLGEAALAAGDLDACQKVIPHLDPKVPQHVLLKCSYFRARGDGELYWMTLNDGVRDCPGDVYLMALRYAEARTALDFPLMREYETIMAYPDTPLAAALLSVEKAFNRLLWCRSENLIAQPSYDSNQLQSATEALSLLRHPRRPISPPGERLKVAYLSNDFTRHAVMGVFSEVLENHDPEAIDLTLLCYTPPEARAWQKNWPRHLRDAVVPIDGKQTVEVLDIIRRLGIDILVDLKGHTVDARLDIVNLADAPVKASYLGYPASLTGAEIDYSITDAVITPEESRAFYAEKLCLLPRTSMPNASLATTSPKPDCERADFGLPDGAFVFCSFNAVFKISPQTIWLWTRVLQEAPESVFWIRLDGTMQRRHLLEALAEGGIDPGRIVFAEATAGYQQHIDRVALADISLDTSPYNGHATTTDMLRAGVPVVALRGTTQPSRMTESLLTAVGMADLVADTEDGFVTIAAALAKEPELYLGVRERLSRNRLTSPLFDPALFARHLEQAYALMADRCRAGLAPDHIIVPEELPETEVHGVAA